VRTLKVGTLNVWNKSGPWAERRELIRRDIAALVPDVLGLQELMRLLPSSPGQKEAPGTLAGRGQGTPNGVPLEPYGVPGSDSPWSIQNDQLSELVDGLSLPEGVSYQRCYFEARAYGGGLMLGNGLLSRFPILEARGFALPGEESGETRCLIYALLETPDGKLPVFVTHLNWKFHHGSVRVRQMRFIVDRIDELAPEGDTAADRLPTVLLGDFNAEPDSDEIRYLRGLHTIEGRSVHFADSWIWAGDGTPGYTFDRKNGFALRSNEPPRRIDYVFVRGPDPALRGEPLRSRLAFTESATSSSGETVWPSDHYGLIAELAAEPRRT
jgi:endonuclease/exonuclease/phosphatase family metal-dependent hydrolase